MAHHYPKDALAATTAQIAVVPFEPAPSRTHAADEPLLLRTSEAAKLLQISERKLYYLLKDGTIPSVHFGRSVRVSRLAIARYIQQQEHQAG